MLYVLLQASFDPPGITVSVKKDRTLETMLQPGNAFAVSMVTESQAKRVRRVSGHTRPWCVFVCQAQHRDPNTVSTKSQSVTRQGLHLAAASSALLAIS
jgi:flavin reductase (DIM6/NTAB) family NADH-FMN oxidoreductase RutF